MPFAVIETGGKQYRVSPGTVISVEKLDAVAGATITFDKVLLLQEKDQPVIGSPFIKDAAVTAEVIEQRKAAKIRVSTYKAKKRQRRTLGHRQQLTQVKIVALSPKKVAAKA